MAKPAELLLSLHCDYSSQTFVLGARLVQSHGFVHLFLLPPACLQVVVISRIVAARHCRDWSHWHAGWCAATAVPHLVQPPGTDSRSRCRSLASVSHSVSTPRPLRRPCWLWSVSTSTVFAAYCLDLRQLFVTVGLCLDLGESFVCNQLIGLEIRSSTFAKGSSPAPGPTRPLQRCAR